MEKECHDSKDSKKLDGKVCAICLAKKNSKPDLHEHYWGQHFWMLGENADEDITLLYQIEDMHFKKGGIKSVWPDCVFWQFGFPTSQALAEFSYFEGSDKLQQQKLYD